MTRRVPSPAVCESIVQIVFIDTCNEQSPDARAPGEELYPEKGRLQSYFYPVKQSMLGFGDIKERSVRGDGCVCGLAPARQVQRSQ